MDENGFDNLLLGIGGPLPLLGLLTGLTPHD